MLNLDLDPLLSLLPPSSHKPSSKHPRAESQRYLLRVLALCALLNILASSSQVHKKKDKMLVSELKSQVDPQSLPLLMEGLLAFKEKLSSADEDDLEDAQVLLECLGEVCSTLDGFDEEEEWSGITAQQDREDEGAMDEDAPEQDEPAAEGMENDNDSVDESMLEDMQGVTDRDEPALPESALKIIHQAEMPSQLLIIAVFEPPQSQNGVLPTSTAPSALDSLSQSWHMVRQRSLEALNNFLFTLARQHATSVLPPPLIQSMWQTLLQLSMTLASAPNDALKSSVGCLWALASVCFDTKENSSESHLLDVQPEHVQALLQLLQSGAVGKDDLVAEIQSRVAGALAVLGARQDVPIDQNDVGFFYPESIWGLDCS